MLPSSIDRSFLVISLAFEQGLIDRDSLMAAMFEWLDTQEEPVMILTRMELISDSAKRDLVTKIDHLILARNGSVEACFDQLSSHVKSAIIQSIAPFSDTDLGRFLQLLQPGYKPSNNDSAEYMVKGSVKIDLIGPAADPRKAERIQHFQKNALFSAGRFIALKKIDGHGMGEIYRGYDTETNRFVAIKTARDLEAYATQQIYDHRLKREGQIHGRLE